MAYIRFCSPPWNWYMYWTSSSPQPGNRNNVLLAIWYRNEEIIEKMMNGEMDEEPQYEFNAHDLRKDVDACLAKITEATAEEKEEAKEFIKYFLEDVDEEYPLHHPKKIRGPKKKRRD